MSSAVSTEGAGCRRAGSEQRLLSFGSRESELKPTRRSGATSENRISSAPSVCETMRFGGPASRTSRPAPSTSVLQGPDDPAGVPAAGGALPQAGAPRASRRATGATGPPHRASALAGHRKFSADTTRPAHTAPVPIITESDSRSSSGDSPLASCTLKMNRNIA